MKLRLSASSIKDYSECPKRFWYRTWQKDKARVSDHVVFGSIVHEAIEKFDDANEAVKWSVEEWNNRMTPEFEFAEIKDVPKPPKSFTKMLGNYYTKIVPELPLDDPQKTELFFEIPWSKTEIDDIETEIIIIGKIDKVAGSNVYDWKTGARLPSKYVMHDFQFYLYDWAYSMLYGKKPKVYYGHLNTGDLFPVEINDYLRNDMASTIWQVVDSIKAEHFQRLAGFQCNSCFYRDFCWGEMEVGIGLEY